MSDDKDRYRHDPQSMDSMFSTILERLSAQDRMHLNARKEQEERHEKVIQKLDDVGKRTDELEKKNLVRDTRAGMIGGAAAALVTAAAWIVDHFTNKP